MSSDGHFDIETWNMFHKSGSVIVADHYMSNDGNVYLTSSVAALEGLWKIGVEDQIRKLVYIPAAADRFREKGFKDYFVNQEREWIKNGIEKGAIKSAKEVTLRGLSSSQVLQEVKGGSAILIGGGRGYGSLLSL